MLIVTILIMTILLLISLIYLYLIQTTGKPSGPKSPSHPQKRVIMIIVDSLMDEALQSLMKEGKAPAFEFLMNSGSYYPKMVTGYPTMSVALDSTLLTGTYPDQHKIPALVWYDEKNKQFISYGSAQKEIRKLGPKQVLTNSLFKLNHQHLSKNVKTIHEELKDPSGSINALVYRGPHTHTLQVPRVLNMLNYLQKGDKVKAPTYFSYGLLSKENPANNQIHIWQAFGFNDKFATNELTYLIKKNGVPAYTLVYFSDNDKKVHKKGAHETKGIEAADKQLQKILNTYDSWDDALKENVWIVMGDSGQSNIGTDKNRSLIDLRKLMNDYRIHKINSPIKMDDQIVLGLNERMCFIYLLDDQLELEHIAEELKKDDRINFAAWKSNDSVNVVSGDEPGILSFKPNGEFEDIYKKSWSLDGNLGILDLKTTEAGMISFGDYPDGLSRLYSAFFSHTGRYVVVDAKPGFEFVGEGSPTHLGGASHGSLHREDSYFPMIVTGTSTKPKTERMVDLKEWILRIIRKDADK